MTGGDAPQVTHCQYVCVCVVSASSVQDRAETWRVHVVDQEEREALYGAAQGAADVQDLHEDPAAVTQVSVC